MWEMEKTNLKNAIWKQLSFSYNYGVLNKESWGDFVLNIKENNRYVASSTEEKTLQ